MALRAAPKLCTSVSCPSPSYHRKVTIPAGLASGASFSATLPGSFRAQATVTVPPGARGGDAVDVRVLTAELGDLTSNEVRCKGGRVPCFI